MILNTERLMLMTLEYAAINKLMAGERIISENLELTFHDEWPRSDTMDILPILKSTMEEGKPATGYELWLIVRKEDMKIIGDIGFKGTPDENNEVEVGYGIVESEWGKGYGFEAAGVLVEWALMQKDVAAVKAETLKNNIASIRILEKLGMKKDSEKEDYYCWKKAKNHR